MSQRIMDVTAFTTLDVVDAQARGPDWSDDAMAVLDVTTEDEADGGAGNGPPDPVRIDYELDPTDLEHVEAHADSMWLSPVQARTLAADLEAAATEATVGDDGADGDDPAGEDGD